MWTFLSTRIFFYLSKDKIKQEITAYGKLSTFKMCIIQNNIILTSVKNRYMLLLSTKREKNYGKKNCCTDKRG